MAPRQKALSKGRPPLPTSRPPARLSPHTTRRIIRAHHRVNAAATAARAAGDDMKAEKLVAQLNLPQYQAASLLGQEPERGGDSSRVLVAWIREYLDAYKGDNKAAKDRHDNGQQDLAGDMEEREELQEENTSSPRKRRKTRDTTSGLRLLEVGALSTRNACARAGIFATVERIDLNAQSEGILKQDFLLRPSPPPLPTQHDSANDDPHDSQRFDTISLSLVLNYVPDALQRGDMLRHTTRFFQRARPLESKSQGKEEEGKVWPFPTLFLVLPRPCVDNSRYFSAERLGSIMTRLGYKMLRRKESNKLVYYLWLWLGEEEMRDNGRGIGKELVKGMEGRGGVNNFRVELRSLSGKIS